jgi:hypothetical protein
VSTRNAAIKPNAIKGRLSCRVCSSSRTEQRKSGEDLLQVHHLTRYELGDGESDHLGGTVDVGDHAARFRSGEATEIGAQTQPDLLRVDGVNVKVDGHHRGTGVAEPAKQRRAGGPQHVRAEHAQLSLVGDLPAASGRSSHECPQARPDRRWSWPAVSEGAPGRRDR